MVRAAMIGRLAFLFTQIFRCVRYPFFSSFQTVFVCPFARCPPVLPAPTTTDAPISQLANDLLRPYFNLHPSSAIPSLYLTELSMTWSHHQNWSRIERKRSKSARLGLDLSLERSIDLFWAVIISVCPYLVPPFI
jgi:hypothetical protein